MLADDILPLLKTRPMTSAELAKELRRTESEILIQLHGELKGLVTMEPSGKWKRMPPTTDGQEQTPPKAAGVTRDMIEDNEEPLWENGTPDK
jgi:hypothetical protein